MRHRMVPGYYFNSLCERAEPVLVIYEGTMQCLVTDTPNENFVQLLLSTYTMLPLLIYILLFKQ
jgi:hypothetical protein